MVDLLVLSFLRYSSKNCEPHVCHAFDDQIRSSYMTVYRYSQRSVARGGGGEKLWLSVLGEGPADAVSY